MEVLLYIHVNLSNIERSYFPKRSLYDENHEFYVNEIASSSLTCADFRFPLQWPLLQVRCFERPSRGL
jgi:hypothetical protein